MTHATLGNDNEADEPAIKNAVKLLIYMMLIDIPAKPHAFFITDFMSSHPEPDTGGRNEKRNHKQTPENRPPFSTKGLLP